KLSELKAVGYRLSLDDYSQTNGILRFDRISHLFDVIRINMGSTNRLKLKDMIEKLRRSRARLLADRVETEEDFDLARSLNFSLFQGYYFEKPVLLSKQIPLGDSPYGRLLNECLRMNVSFDRCCKIIEDDALLTHLFLQQVPGARRQRGRMGADIKSGLMSMGTEGLRRWISLVLLKQANTSRSDDLPRQAYARGRFIERLAENADSSVQPGQGFFVGLISLLDQVMGVRLPDILADLNLGPALKAALLGREENDYSLFLQYAVIYEMNNPRLILPNLRIKLSDREVADIFQRCQDEAVISLENIGNGNMIGVGPAYQGNIIR
ncbi:MAG: EAL domain-containing protein, partial [Oscillibacter sp.]|nr:EAL domain-containing protein [Oscillibacter sp.]